MLERVIKVEEGILEMSITTSAYYKVLDRHGIFVVITKEDEKTTEPYIVVDLFRNTGESIGSVRFSTKQEARDYMEDNCALLYKSRQLLVYRVEDKIIYYDATTNVLSGVFEYSKRNLQELARLGLLSETEHLATTLRDILEGLDSI